MKRKIMIMGISFGLTIIIFLGLVIFEKRLVNYSPKKTNLIALEDIQIGEKLSKDMFIEQDIDISLVTNGVGSFGEIDGLYAKENIYKGQILSKREIDTKENLKIIEVPEGLEKIAVKIKSAENGVGYQLKKGDRVNLYFTGRYSVIKDSIIGLETSPVVISDENSMCTVKLLDKSEMLGIFDESGRNIIESDFGKVDSIVFAVDNAKAKVINNLRSQGTFDITGV